MSSIYTAHSFVAVQKFQLRSFSIAKGSDVGPYVVGLFIQ